jgi:hypothetical protein
MYKVTAGAHEDQFGDQHLVAGYYNQPKKWTQDNGEPLHKVATAHPRAGSHKAGSWVICQALENKYQGTVEESALSETKEETIDSLHAGTVGAQDDFKGSAPTKWEAQASRPA